MHVLITGPAGSGKTTLAEEFRKHGKNGVDADLSGIGVWLDKQGRVVEVPEGLDMRRVNEWADKNGLSWNWDEDKLRALLTSSKEMFLIGGAKNTLSLAKYFDRRYYLYADEEFVLERLDKRNREGTNYHDFGRTEAQRNTVIESIRGQPGKARRDGFEIIDARLTPKQIFDAVINDMRASVQKRRSRVRR